MNTPRPPLHLLRSILKGLHQLGIARHRESVPGFHLGREHDLTSHNACLTWLQP